MSRKTRKVGPVGRLGPRYGVRIRRRAQEVEESLRRRHTCPQCSARSVRRASAGIWKCRRCGAQFAGGAYRPVVTTAVKREVTATTEEVPEPEEEAAPEEEAS